MKPSRRWFQYSLRSFLVLLAALAVWLGIVVNRAREQREAVKAIEAKHGTVYYDWELMTKMPQGWVMNPACKAPGGPIPPLHISVDRDFFQEAKVIQFTTNTPEADVLKLIPALQRLRVVDQVGIAYPLTKKARHILEAALPDCDIYTSGM